MSRKRISIAAAVAANGVIGAGGQIPWHSKEDLRHFARLTRGGALVMGRKTYESIGRALAGRMTIVVSRSSRLRLAGCEIRTSLASALAAAQERFGCEIFVAGGGEIYAAALPAADRLVISKFTGLQPPGDTRFPQIDPRQWRLAGARAARAEPAFVVECYERR